MGCVCPADQLRFVVRVCVTLPMTGWSHQNDGDVTGLLFGASAAAAAGIRPNGAAPVTSPLLRNSD